MKVFISAPVPESVYQGLSDFQVFANREDRRMSEEELIQGCQKADILLCPLSDKITQRIIESAPNLKMIANFGAGFDNIDTAYAKTKGIPVTNAPAPSSTSSTAEITLALMLAVSRRLVEGDKNTRAGRFDGWKPVYHLGKELRGKTLGIFGLGRIGKSVAKKAQAFDMKVIYTTRTPLSEEENQALGLKAVSFDELLETSDFLSFHTAYHPDLHHLLNADNIKKMKPTAYVINAARGPLIDEQALADALKAGTIAGAGLDVYEFEPTVTEDLIAMDNVVLAPHLGNATWEARDEMGAICVRNIKLFSEGKALENRVNG